MLKGSILEKDEELRVSAFSFAIKTIGPNDSSSLSLKDYIEEAAKIFNYLKHGVK